MYQGMTSAEPEQNQTCARGGGASGVVACPTRTSASGARTAVDGPGTRLADSSSSHPTAGTAGVLPVGCTSAISVASLSGAIDCGAGTCCTCTAPATAAASPLNGTDPGACPASVCPAGAWSCSSACGCPGPGSPPSASALPCARCVCPLMSKIVCTCGNAAPQRQLVGILSRLEISSTGSSNALSPTRAMIAVHDCWRSHPATG